MKHEWELMNELLAKATAADPADRDHGSLKDDAGVVAASKTTRRIVVTCVGVAGILARALQQSCVGRLH